MHTAHTHARTPLVRSHISDMLCMDYRHTNTHTQSAPFGGLVRCVFYCLYFHSIGIKFYKCVLLSLSPRFYFSLSLSVVLSTVAFSISTRFSPSLFWTDGSTLKMLFVLLLSSTKWENYLSKFDSTHCSCAECVRARMRCVKNEMGAMARRQLVGKKPHKQATNNTAHKLLETWSMSRISGYAYIACMIYTRTINKFPRLGINRIAFSFVLGQLGCGTNLITKCARGPTNFVMNMSG